MASTLLAATNLSGNSDVKEIKSEYCKCAFLENSYLFIFLMASLTFSSCTTNFISSIDTLENGSWQLVITLQYFAFENIIKTVLDHICTDVILQFRYRKFQ